jgi:hypothetical protein
VKRERSVKETGRPLKLIAPPGTEFRPEFLDFERGIRVGNLEENERITRILKLALESGFGETFTTVRWGRGVYWQWIGLFPQANRLAKPVSSHVNFGCAKYFVSLERDEKRFKAGMQVERGYLRPPREYPQCKLREDWDWNRLLVHLKPRSELERRLQQLVKKDGFRLFAGSWAERHELSARDFNGATEVRKLLTTAPAKEWCGFQLFYPMEEKEVRAMSGLELIEAILAVFSEVTPAMNRCMQIELASVKQKALGVKEK